MKKFYTLIFLFFISTVLMAQNTYVPDDNFEQALINLGYDDILDDYVLTNNINNITTLDVQDSRFGIDDFGIRDLTGIEDFGSLEYLDCSHNNIINLDFSSNTALEDLFCNFNDLISLNVTSNTALKILNCDSNELTQLNVTFNPALEILYCVDNDITRLDVSLNTVLVRLRCSENNLTFLNVKNGNNYNFASDVVLGFEASSNPDLTCIQVDDADYSWSNWSHIDITANYNEKCYAYIPDDAFEQHLIDQGYDSGPLDDYVLAENISRVFDLYIPNKGISDLTGIECFTELQLLTCNDNNLTSLDLGSNIYLIRAFCQNNNLTYLNAGSSSLEILNCDNNDLTDLNLDINTLQELYCSDNDLTNLSVRSNSLITLYCDNNDLTYLSVESTSLIYLFCSNNNLTNLTVNSAYRLAELGCANNALNYLNVQYFNLEALDCSNNNLTSIENINTNSRLYYLDCNNNNINSLDLTSNRALNVLDCSYNNLTTLNVQNGNNTILGDFNAVENPDLRCILVDNESYSVANWFDGKDATATFSVTCFAGLTRLTDNAFEEALIDLGYDDFLDGYVATSIISGITVLNVNGKGISDLTGIEDFSALEALYCKNNNLTALDLSSNTLLKALDCSDNKLESLNLKNGNNINFIKLDTTGNPNLMCIQIDEIKYCNVNWKDYTYGSRHFCIDKHTKFSENCELLGVNEIVDTSYKIYPNPVKDELYINLNNGLELKQINIYNTLSQYLYSVKTSKMDVSGLTSGIYFIEVETNQGKSAKKMVIE